jgi:regulator of sigma D
LTVKDISGEGEIVFTSPMSTASLKGCHEVQNLGAVETYIKRYLYQNAFEIVEADALNGTHNPNEKPEPKKENARFDEVASALLDYLEAGVFEHPGNVEKVIADKNLAGMEKALAVAKEREAQNG